MEHVPSKNPTENTYHMSLSLKTLYLLLFMGGPNSLKDVIALMASSETTSPLCLKTSAFWLCQMDNIKYNGTNL